MAVRAAVTLSRLATRPNLIVSSAPRSTLPNARMLPLSLRTFASTPQQPPSTTSPSSTSDLSPAISAFQARLALVLKPTLLLQSLTHKSFHGGREPHNDRLELLGEQVIRLYVTEYLHCKYPNLPSDAFMGLVEAHAGSFTLSRVARQIGLHQVMQWKNPVNDPTLPAFVAGENTLLRKTFCALVGAIYHAQGSRSGRLFIKGLLLSRDVDVSGFVKMEEPKRVLAALMKKLDRPFPVTRLLKETGRLSTSPVFIVGVFSGPLKLGEGYGSSIKMAETRAARKALQSYFLEELKVFSVPSETEEVAEDELTFYNPTKLGQGDVIA